MESLRLSLVRIHSLTLLWEELDSLALQPFSPESQARTILHNVQYSSLVLSLNAYNENISLAHYCSLLSLHVHSKLQWFPLLYIMYLTRSPFLSIVVHVSLIMSI